VVLPASGKATGKRNGLDMHGDGIFYISAVTARHRNRNRNFVLTRQCKHHLIACRQSGKAQLHATQTIALMRIGAGR